MTAKETTEERISEAWEYLEAVTKSLRWLQENYSFDPGTTPKDDPVPFNIHSAIHESAAEIEIVRMLISEIARDHGLDWIRSAYENPDLADVEIDQSIPN